MGSSFRSSLLFRVVVLLVFCSGSGLQAQTLKTTSVVGPRPVRDVILQWEKQYGWVITYEDPRFEYASDLEDVTEGVRKGLKPGEPIDPSRRIIGARERQLSVSYTEPKTATDTGARLEAAKQLVSAYVKNSGNTFVIEQSDTRLHVLPGLIRNASGELQPSKPMLDTVISVPAQDRSGMEFLHAFCDALTGATGRTVSLGMTPSSALAQFRSKSGYENLPARQILGDFLNHLPKGDRYTWALLFQRDYGLNIHWVGNVNTSSEPVRRSSPSRARVMKQYSSPDGTKTVYVAR